MKIKKAKCCGTCKHFRYRCVGTMIGDCVFKFNVLKPTEFTSKCDDHEWKTENGMDSGG